MIVTATYFANSTGTALPIICSKFVFAPLNLKSSGNVCNLALSKVVNGLTFSEILTGSPACPKYPSGIGLLTPLTVGAGSSIEKIALLL